MSARIVLQSKFTADVIEDFLNDFKDILLEKKEDLLIDFSQVEKIDIAGVQLILVLLRTALVLNRDVSFEPNVSREVWQKFIMGGFISPDEKDLKGGLLSLMS